MPSASYATPPWVTKLWRGAFMRAIRASPARTLTIAGGVTAAMITVGGGAVGPVGGTAIPTRWFGLLAAQTVDRSRDPWPGVVLLLGILGLVATWLAMLRWISLGRLAARQLRRIIAVWWLPLVLGPPVLSGDVYSYAAQGVLQLHDVSPYRFGIIGLGDSTALLAVDPRWRSVTSPYGPLTSAIEHVAAWLAHGDVLTTVILLRIVAVGSLVAVGILAWHLARPPLRLTALALTVANPVFLLNTLSAAHLEALMAALVLGALVAAGLGHRTLGAVLAVLAGTVKAPLLILALAIVVFPVVTAGSVRRWRPALGRSAAAALAAFGGLCSLVPDGWGWIAGLRTPGLATTPFAPTQLLFDVVRMPLRLVGLGDPTITALCRLLGMVTAAAIVGYLLATGHRRPLPISGGLALLTVAVLGPVFYPWYLLWGAACLAPFVVGRHRWWLAGGSATACLLDIPGIATPIAVGAVSLGLLVAIAGLSWLYRRPLTDPHPVSTHPVLATAGR